MPRGSSFEEGRSGLASRIRQHLNPLSLLGEAVSVSLILFRIMIPVLLVVKLLQETGGIRYLGMALAPVMRLVGLPGSMGLVWATSMVTNMYGGIIVFLNLLPDNPLTVAQVTVLATMICLAHSLPVELRIAQKSGVRMRFCAPLRIVGAFALGAILNLVYRAGGWLEQPSSPVWNPGPQDTSLSGWALDQLENLGVIFLMVLGLLLLMRVLRVFGAADALDRFLRPVLTSMGIGGSAATITVFGLVLGISYGGGLILRAATSGRAEPRDVFFAMCLMSLCHSLGEDTLLMLSLGSSITGVLLARVVFAWLVMYALVRLVSRMPQRIFERHLFRGPSASPVLPAKGERDAGPGL
ncbi:hypothetical protein JW921_07345 [Candidatus Fermentibacterales bacterium]|nr:hypothetical protein [Candidatus Fermentibacterales bacterium]